MPGYPWHPFISIVERAPGGGLQEVRHKKKPAGPPRPHTGTTTKPPKPPVTVPQPPTPIHQPPFLQSPLVAPQATTVNYYNAPNYYPQAQQSPVRQPSAQQTPVQQPPVQQPPVQQPPVQQPPVQQPPVQQPPVQQTPVQQTPSQREKLYQKYEDLKAEADRLERLYDQTIAAYVANGYSQRQAQARAEPISVDLEKAEVNRDYTWWLFTQA